MTRISRRRARAPEDMTQRLGPIEIDWPRSIGFFGAIGAAVALDLSAPPVGVFIAAVPFLKMLDRPGVSSRLRYLGHLIDGAAKPVGGDAEGTVRLVKPSKLPLGARSRKPVSR
jgi:hypothetical protein